MKRPRLTIWRNASGSTAIEWALIAALISLLILSVFVSVNETIEAQYLEIEARFRNAG